jgi:hypothetical protein
MNMTSYLLEAKDSIKKLFVFLYLSLTSPNFYRDVILNFRGFGVRYVINLTFLGTVAGSVMLSYIVVKPISEYLENKNISSYHVEVIDYIISSWPSVEYDGHSIKTNSNEPVLLKYSGKTVAAIDPANSLKGNEKEEIYAIFTKTSFLMNVIINGKNLSTMPIKYETLFGSGQKIISSDVLIDLLKDFLLNYKTISHIIFVMLLLLYFIAIILDKSMIVLIIYFSLKYLTGRNFDMKTAIRVVAFSSGLYCFLLPLSFVHNIIPIIASLSQILTGSYIVYVIIGMKKN